MDKNLKEYKKSNEDNLDKSQDYFEKQLSFISAGALGVSMFFIEKVIKDLHSSSYKLFLIASWILFGVTLIINLVSHFLAIKFNYTNLEEIETEHYSQQKSIRRNAIIKWLNFTTLISLVIGIIFLILYVSLNL